MRSGPNKRSRGRGNNNPNNMNGAGGNNGGGGGRPRQPHRSQTYDSNGPGMKIRGNAYQVFERYVALAREAASAGDRIAAENFYQHAEHYFRVMNANGESPQHFRQQQPQTDGGEGEQPETGEATVQHHQQPQAEHHPDHGHQQHEQDQEAQPAAE